MYLVISRDWEQPLRQAGLDAFTTLWDQKDDWVETPNQRRGGWSGVIKRTLPGNIVVFIKRQEGQNRKTILHPLRGKPTYYLEYRFLHRYRKQFPQLVDWACYGQARSGDKDRAILATAGLVCYRDLDEVAASEPRERLKQALRATARAVLPLHLKRLQHGALYSVHIFAHQDSDEIRLIDLERARLRARRRTAALSDLSQFVRRTAWLDQDLFATFIQPWEEHFPGISRQLPQPGPGQEDSP